jgi:hypothetical protein
VLVSYASFVVEGFGAHQEEVILDQIPLKRLQRQRSVAEGHDEVMVRVLPPDGSYIRSLEEVVREPEPRSAMSVKVPPC